MIDVYAGPTPNGQIALLALEELELAYSVHRVALFEGAHHAPEFLQLNPAAQIPVIVDRDPRLDEPVTLSQTTAILLYLAEKTGRLLPREPGRRARALEALALHASDLAPSFYLAHHLERLLQSDDEKIRSALRMRGLKYYAVLDGWLRRDDYLAGPECSIADVAAYPWAMRMPEAIFGDLPGLARWRERMSARSAVGRTMAVVLD